MTPSLLMGQPPDAEIPHSTPKSSQAWYTRNCVCSARSVSLLADPAAGSGKHARAGEIDLRCKQRAGRREREGRGCVLRPTEDTIRYRTVRRCGECTTTSISLRSTGKKHSSLMICRPCSCGRHARSSCLCPPPRQQSVAASGLLSAQPPIGRTATRRAFFASDKGRNESRLLLLACGWGGWGTCCMESSQVY